MPLQIDINSIDLNVGNSGFSANYLPVLSIDEPSNCQLPPLVAGNFSLPTTPLTSVNAGCKYQFTTVFPTSPPFAPKPIPPVCPTGGDFSGTVSLIGTGALTVSNGNLTLSGGPCNGTLSGGPVILNVPEIPCPLGNSFSGNAIVTTSGIASGGGSISVSGGPCGFVINGLIDIYVPPVAAGSGGGSNVQCVCQDCSKTCCQIRSAIETQYGVLGTIPKLGDVIDVCVAVYEVVGNPNPTSTCDGSCPNLSEVNVIDFTIGSTTYFARKISDKCPNTPFFVTINQATNQLVVLTGTLSQNASPGSSVSISGLNTPKSFTDGDLVYLLINVSSYLISSVSVEVDTDFNISADPWSTGAVTEDDGGSPPVQILARYLIATITGTTSKQSCNTNLMSSLTCIDGYPALYPLPI